MQDEVTLKEPDSGRAGNGTGLPPPSLRKRNDITPDPAGRGEIESTKQSRHFTPREAFCSERCLCGLH